MSTPVIQVENVSKLYQLGLVGTKSLAHDINRWWYRVRGKEDPYIKIGQVNDRTKKGESDFVWALKDVSFELHEGEVLGIIGKNGAGKSTLLKIMSRVTRPTTGRVVIKGRISSLLEVGTGFHPELTGKENIFLNGAILGMRRQEVAARLDEIVAFSGCERYIDTPVKRYSSGMYVRLAFSVAAHLDVDIMIMDEVLAVGDAEFQKACFAKLGALSESAKKAVVLVSHNMDAITRMCKRVLLVNNGEIVCSGTAQHIVDNYMGVVDDAVQRTYLACEKNAIIRRIVLICDSEDRKNIYTLNEDINLEITLGNASGVSSLVMAINITNRSGDLMAHVVNEDGSFDVYNEVRNRESSVVRIRLHSAPLPPGKYFISLWLGRNHYIEIEKVDSAVSFDVVAGSDWPRGFPYPKSARAWIRSSWMLSS